MEKICPNCGSSMPETSRFCTECGKPFPVPQPKQAPKKPDPPKQQDAQEQPIPLMTQEPQSAQSASFEQPSQFEQTRPAGAYIPSQSPSQSAGEYTSAQPQPTGTYYPNADPAHDAYRTAEPEPGPDSPYQPVSTWGWFGSLILLSIPIIGLIITIVWACGGCRKVSKRNYCRALLINLAITLILVGVIGSVCYSVISKVLNDPAVQDALPQLAQGLPGDLGFLW